MAARITTPTALLIAALASFGVVLGCAIGCGELLRLAERSHGSTAFDSSVTSWVIAHRAHGLTTLARVLSTLGSQVVLAPVMAVTAVALLVRRRFVLAGLVVAAWGGAIALYNITKHVVDRPRPPAAIWLTKVAKTSSFPSGHATQSLACFLALALVGAVWVSTARWQLRLVALAVAAGVGWSRVYLGVHWATDVLAGWLIAAAWLTVLARLVRAATSADARAAHGRALGAA
ncbi:MAG: phosphatase PAP2 family protein [Solirubrobacterales bacterium]|nr:phosphatase PAP2 family protein [Solirubrobacterales bacterium]